MISYLSLFRLRQWRALSKTERRRVWRGFVHPLLMHSQLMLLKMFLLFMAIQAGMQSAGSGAVVSSVVFMVAATVLVPEVFDVCLLARFRRDVEAYLQRYVSEIQPLV